MKPVTLTFELDLYRDKMCQRAYTSDVNLFESYCPDKDRGTDSHSGLISLSGPLKWSMKTSKNAFGQSELF